MHEFLRHLIDAGIVLPGTTETQLRAMLPLVANEAEYRRALNLEPATWKDDDRGVDGVLSTDAPVPMPDFERMEIVDEVLLTSGFRARGGNVLPLQDSHQTYSVHNTLGSFAVKGPTKHEINGRLFISSAEESVATKVREGHVRGISVGYQNRKWQYVEPGQSAEIDGRTFRAKKNGRAVKVVTEWEAMEASLTPVPADIGAGIRSRGGAVVKPQLPVTTTTRGGVEIMNLIRRFLEANPNASADQLDAFRKWIADQSGTPTDDQIRSHLTDQKLTWDKPEQKVEQKSDTDTRQQQAVDPAEAARAAVAADRTRRAAIRAAAKPWEDVDGVTKMAEAAMDSEQDAGAFRAALYDHLEKKRPALGRVTVTHDSADKRREAMSDALCLRAGTPILDDRGQRVAPAQVSERTSIANEFRGLTLFETARACLEYAGVNTRGMDRMELVGRAFTHSSADFDALLENSARKALLNAFQNANVTWREFCSVGNLSDFKAHSRAMMSQAGLLTEVPEGAEIPEHTLTDKKETITLKTYGKIFAITRQAIINDDLNAFSRIPALHGAAWARTINYQAYEKMLTNPTLSADSTALYDASTHLNLDTSATAVTTVATAAAIVRLFAKKMALQKDMDGTSLLNLMLQTIVVGPTLAPHYQQAIFETGLADNNSAVDIRGKGYRVVVDAEVENTGHTSGAATNATYGFADPSVAPVLEVGFLDGNEMPRMERENGFEVEGVKWKVAGEVAVAPVDYRGTQKHVN